MTFGQRLTEARTAKGLTQAQLGEGLGTDGKDAGKAVVLGWEKDRHFPRADQLAMICAKLRCSADWLLTGSEVQAGMTPEAAELGREIDGFDPTAREHVLKVIRETLAFARKAVGREQEPRKTG